MPNPATSRWEPFDFHRRSGPNRNRPVRRPMLETLESRLLLDAAWGAESIRHQLYADAGLWALAGADRAGVVDSSHHSPVEASDSLPILSRTGRAKPPDITATQSGQAGSDGTLLITGHTYKKAKVQLDIGANGSVEQTTRSDRRGNFKFTLHVDFGQTHIRIVARLKGKKPAKIDVSADRPTPAPVPPQVPPVPQVPQVITGAITVTNLQESDGTPADQSRMVVPFTQAITLVDSGKLSLAGTAVNPVDPAHTVSVSIAILSATTDAADARNLVLTTGTLVPEGANLSIGAGAITGTAGQALPAQTVAVPQGLSMVDFTMANRAFKPTDVDMFSTGAYVSASHGTTPTTVLDEATARAELDAFLGLRVTAGVITDAERTAALARYDAAATKAIIPAPRSGRA